MKNQSPFRASGWQRQFNVVQTRGLQPSRVMGQVTGE